MKIKTITCHEVYNHGASLQEYALLKYLDKMGHESQAINYKPAYLSTHFNLWRISNKSYQRNGLLKAAYLTLKLPGRLLSLKRKKSFDRFSKKFIQSTERCYSNNNQLKMDLPEADAYICGSDQIWNSFFENGKDPAFYLDFVPNDILKISYAASFAIDELEADIEDFVRTKVKRINHISVREPSGVKILRNLSIDRVTHVLDPVFLLEENEWKNMSDQALQEEYIFVYDCDSDPLIEKFVKGLQVENDWIIVTVNNNIRYADKNFYYDGPTKFLSLINNAQFIVSNSFHAVAFSVIFKKQFTVFNRSEKINTRMRDFVDVLKIPEVLIKDDREVEKFNYVIEYDLVQPILESLLLTSKNFLSNSLNVN